MINKYNKFLNENTYKDEFLRLYNLATDSLKKLVDDTKEVQQGVDWHPEGVTYIHIRLVTNRLENTYHNINLNLAGFFHDLGKTSVTKPNGRGGFSAHGHEDESVKIVEEYKDWIIEQGGAIDIVKYVVANHMRYKYIDEMRLQEVMRFMDEPYFHYVEKFATADIGGADLNCVEILDYKEIKQKIHEFEKKEKENKIISKKFNAGMIMDKYPELRKEKLGRALAGFKKRHEDFRSFVLNNRTEDILKDFDDYMMIVNEGVRDLMTPISKEKIDEFINKYPLLHSALMKAIRDNEIDIAEMIIQRGADVSDYNEEALRTAANLEHSDMVIMLLQNGADPDAAIEYHRTIDSTRYSHVIDEIRFFSPYAVKNSQNESVGNTSVRDMMTPKSEEDIRKSFNGLTQKELDWKLWVSVSGQQIPLIRILLKLGANPNAKNKPDGNTILFNAIMGGITTQPNMEIIKMLLDGGANPMIPNVRGIMTLKFAETWKKWDILELLKQYVKVDESVRDKMTPKSEEDILKSIEGLDQMALDQKLLDAVQKHQIDRIQILLNAGANPNTKDGAGNTLLFKAIVGGIVSKPNIEIASMLLKNGADPTNTNNRGVDTLKWAEIWKKWDMVELLKQYIKVEESVRDKMIPKSDEEINKSIEQANRNVKEEDLPLANMLLACETGIEWLAKKAIKDGIDVNFHDGVFLQATAVHGQLEIAKLLLDNGAEPNDYAYNLAMAKGYRDICLLFGEYK